MSHVAS